MRELHCTPSQLRQESLSDLLSILTMLGVEAKIQKQRAKRRG